MNCTALCFPSLCGEASRRKAWRDSASRQRNVGQVNTQLIPTVHPERLLGKGHELFEGFVGGKHEGQHAIHVGDRLLHLSRLHHSNRCLTFVFGHIAIPIHTLRFTSCHRIAVFVRALGQLCQDLFELLGSREEVPGPGVDVLTPFGHSLLDFLFTAGFEILLVALRGLAFSLCCCALLLWLLPTEQHSEGIFRANAAIPPICHHCCPGADRLIGY
mmetsp:Transcript_55914/g.122306  ORF Transcript_55914/g.122306 Transcript_55914/m.122306 type:complete len:216 (+) Transcript_55914:42-689(+)